MRWGRRPRLELVVFFLATSTESVRRWATERQVPGWVQELPGGWTLFRTVTVDGQLVATSLSPEEVLVEWSTRAESYLIEEDVLSGVRAGQAYVLPDDIEQAPWEADDHRPRHGLVAARGDRLADLTLFATGTGESQPAVLRDGWTLVPHDNPGLVCEVLCLDDATSAIGLLAEGDEFTLWLASEGEVVASWDWSVMGSAVATDRLPLGEIGAAALEGIDPPRLGVSPFVEHGFAVASVEALGRVLATPGTADEIVPALTSALGLPDAARTHLLGWAELADDPDAVRAQPARSTAAAIAGAVAGQERKEALARSPRRRLWGAIVGAVFIVVMLTLLVVLVPAYLSGAEPWSWWEGLRLGIGVLLLPMAAMGVWNWWKLRGAGQHDAAPTAPTAEESKVRRWMNRRGPATAISLAMGLMLAVIGALAWRDVAALREYGVETNATVLAVTEDDLRVEFQLPDGRSATASVQPRSDLRPGDVVTVIYDPADPEDAELAEDVHDNVLYLILGGGAVFCLVAAALTWWRVIDAQKIDDWIN